MTKDKKQEAAVVDLDAVRWKKSVERTAKKIKRIEDIDIELHTRVITRPGMVGMSIGFSMKPKEEKAKEEGKPKDGKDTTKTHIRGKNRTP